VPRDRYAMPGDGNEVSAGNHALSAIDNSVPRG
jgi:hypothetical protein